MKKILFILLLAACNSKPKEVNTNPILIKTDTITVEANKTWFYEVNQPLHGKARLDIWNYENKQQKYIIEIKEIK